MSDEAMRIQRALARAGVAGRRAAERMVVEGRVAVNGVPAQVGQSVSPADEITVDGKRVESQTRRTLLLNKSRGVLSSVSDARGRPTVIDGLPDLGRLYPVGRLDLQTTGAILISNDGELAHRLTHPSYGVTKTYQVLFAGKISSGTLRRLREGVTLDDGPTAPAGAKRMDRRSDEGTWVELELHEGRNRQIRRMGEAIDHPVVRLHRSRYAGLGLRDLPPGSWRELHDHELRTLAGQVGLER
jgi:23S rRNA pseudouridine2605 synthase